MELCGPKGALNDLCEGETGFLVGVVDLLDRVHIGSGTQVQAEVVLGGSSHNLLQRGMIID